MPAGQLRADTDNVQIAAICDCDESRLASAPTTYPDLVDLKLRYWIENFASGDIATQLVHDVDKVRWVNDPRSTSKYLKRDYREPYVVPDHV